MALSFPSSSGSGRQLHSSALLRPAAVWMLILLTMLSSSLHMLVSQSAELPDIATSDAMAFVPNVGQSAAPVRFQSAAQGASLFFTQSEVLLALPTHAQSALAPAAQAATILRLSFIGANPELSIRPDTLLPGRINALLGNDPSTWHTNIPSYAAISYQQLYPGVSMRYEGQSGNLKSTYYLAPGADPAQIRWRYQGAQQLALSQAGNLNILMPDGRTIVEQAPIAWQTINGQRLAVRVHFVLEADQSLRFALGAYNPAQPLIIDPTLSYSSYLRGASANTDAATDVAMATENGTTYAYLTGVTFSAVFPSGGSSNSVVTSVRPDIFVTKINPALSGAASHVYTTIIGGGSADSAYALVAQNDGRVFLAGSTASNDFPMAATQTLDTSYGGGAMDAFVLGLAANGTSLEFASFLGGSGNDTAYGLDGNQNSLAVVGVTNSAASGFPVASQLPKGGADDAFVLLLNTPLSAPAVDYFSFLGGDDSDGARAVALSNKRIFLTGWTQSFNTDFPYTDGTDKTAGDRDAFVTSIDPAQTGTDSLVYSRSLYGSGDDEGYGLRVNASQQAVVIGTSDSTNFPTTNGSLKPTKTGGDDDAFVAVIANASPAPALVASSYLGMSGNESARDLALAPNGTIFVTGSSDSADFGLSSLQNYGGGSDAFVAKLSANLSLRLYTTYLGGSGSDISYGIAVDDASQVYIAGATGSADYYSLPPAPLKAGFETTGGGASYSTDGFFAMLVNTAPTLTTADMTVAEGSTTALSATQLSANDSDDDPSALIFTLSDIPDHGKLTLDPDGAGAQPAQDLALNDSFTNAQLLAGYVSYVHDGSETSSDSFAVTLSDSLAITAAATVNITITPVNDPPTIEPQSFTIAENSPNATVVGTVSASDPDSTNLTYSITAGNTNNAFAINQTTGELTVANSAALDLEVNPSFTLTVQVSDGALNASTTVTITLTNVNEPPVINPQSFSIAENSPNASLVGTVAASDPDANPTLTYSITAGNTNNAFAIDSATGKITVNNTTALDYETTPSFSLTVQVSDGALNASTTVTITLTDLNDVAPVITSTGFSIAENSANGTTVGTLAITDPDGAAPTYSITGGTGQAVFAIDSATGKITVSDSNALDYETTSSFSLDVQVSDGVHTVSKTLTITVTDANDNPPVLSVPAPFDVAENTANTTPVGTPVTATDLDQNPVLSFSITAGNTNNAFAINASTGQLSVNNSTALDYETNPVFNLNVQVSDGKYTDSDVVVINLTDVNEPPTLAAQSFTIDENSANATLVGSVVATDPDKGATLSYSITAGSTNTAFAIDSAGKLTVNNQAALDYETTPVFTLTVEVSDGVNIVSNTVTVNLNNLNDNAPVFAAQSFTLPENSANATVVGSLTASDADKSTLSYSITAGNTNNAFALNASTGQLSVNNAAALDYETTPVFSLTVQVSDGSFNTSNTVTINLTNVNEAPVLDASGDMKLGTIAEDIPVTSNNGTLVADILASAGANRITDQDANALQGIAVIAANAANGSWEFSVDGTTWTSFGRISNTSAVLLAADTSTRVRFLPAANYYGLVDPGITFRAWDQTAGSNGATNVDLSTNGGSSAWSTATETASITVTSVNDLPTATNDQLMVEKDSTDNILKVLSNDSTAPDTGETLLITAVAAAAHGTVQINSTGDALIYTPANGYEGFDSFTYTVTDSNGGSASATVRVRVGPYRTMLPQIYGNPLAPDLEITSFTVTPAGNSYKVGQAVQISVTIKNTGTVHTGGFWVDLYINPKNPPTGPNIPWESNCGMKPCYGIAWLVKSGIAGGESITLTSTADSYYADNSFWPGSFAAGTRDLYVYVDSWNGNNPNGAIAERDETNNRAELHSLQVSGTTTSFEDTQPIMQERYLP